VCGATLSADATACATCGWSADPVPPASGRGGARSASASTDNPFVTDLNRRLARLAQWAGAAEPLGVDLPRLPPWAEEAAVRSRNPEPWAEVVRAVERLAQRRVAEAFDRWEELTSGRIGRLEAYSVDSRLERGQVEDAVHAAKVGDLASALATYQQVDRVVALKERHLDQARGELERLLAFLRDLEALGLFDTGAPAEVAAELERELRTGRLAPLKQRLRLLRSRAIAHLGETLPGYVRDLGDRLASENGAGSTHDTDVKELAAAVRSVYAGQTEDGVHRLRLLKEARGIGAGPRSNEPAAGSSRRP
jgi:hypothetical protein